MGYVMRAERTLLVDFVRFIIARGGLSPIRAQVALDWATETTGQRGVAGTATRLIMARRFGLAATMLGIFTLTYYTQC
jgi:hypothetical protein